MYKILKAVYIPLDRKFRNQALLPYGEPPLCGQFSIPLLVSDISCQVATTTQPCTDVPPWAPPPPPPILPPRTRRLCLHCLLSAPCGIALFAWLFPTCCPKTCFLMMNSIASRYFMSAFWPFPLWQLLVFYSSLLTPSF